MASGDGDVLAALGPEPRLLVMGTTGSGKTTVGRRIAEILDVPFVELDALHWGPNWTERPLEVFRNGVREAAAGPAWVIDGNYGTARDLAMPRATAVVWLDYPFWTNFRQLLVRTARRCLRSEVLWSGNTERLRTQLFTGDSIILWFFKSYWRRKRTYGPMLSGPEARHLVVFRLEGRGETDAWLRRLQAAASMHRRPRQP